MIHRFESIDSTNNHAKLLAQQGAPHGTVVVADRQTGGRGRLGRSFHSPAGVGLYLSMILRPQCKANALMHLTCAAAVAACAAIKETTGIDAGIKWTNDLVFGKQKLGGILTELGFQGDTIDYAVIGIGINCNHLSNDFPPELQDMATSLAMVRGTPISKNALESSLIQHLLSISHGLLTDKNQIMEQYRENCITLGKEVSIAQGDSVFHATALDIDEDGGLVVQLPDGNTKTVAFGEVSVRGMYGYL